MEMPDAAELDAAYRSFPTASVWSAAVVDEALWNDTVRRLQAAQSSVPDAVRIDEVDRSLRAAALNTGALEGLHNADRGLTLTVIAETA